jgi:hypothetical protein
MSRLITTGSKLYFGIAGLAAVAAVIYGYGSGGGLSGPPTLGLLGGVGELAGYTILVSLSGVAACLGAMTAAYRDADAEAVIAAAGAERLPAAVPPRTASYWPALGAVAVVLVMIGLADSPGLVILGGAIGGIVVIEWMVHAWSDRATGDPEANREIRNRFMNPIEIPLFGAVGIIVLVLSVSRVLLALPEYGSDAVAIAFAVLVLGVCALIATRPQVRRTVVVALLVLLAIAVIAAGLVAAASGTRSYEKHEGMATAVEQS